MHSLMSRVLAHRQLSAASQLFALTDYDVITDLNDAFPVIKEIFKSPSYISSRIDQSVVEICITRITAAIRQTDSISTYCAQLVDLLSSSLLFPMTSFDEEGKEVDSPHCKIANDLLSSLFLHYNKRSVMTLTLPVALEALSSCNADLVRSTTSFLSLSAIHSGKSLSQYASHIIQHIKQGNLNLLRVLPQIYPDNRAPFHANLSAIIANLASAEADGADKISVLQLAGLVAAHQPELLSPFLPCFQPFLHSEETATAVVNILMTLVSQGRAEMLQPYLPSIAKATQCTTSSSRLSTLWKIIGNIGRTSLESASFAVSELLRSAEREDTQLPAILSEIDGIVAVFPSSVDAHREEIARFGVGETSRIVQRIIRNNITRCSSRNASSSFSQSIKEEANSRESLLSTGKQNGTMMETSDSAAELDRNLASLASLYNHNRSCGSLSRTSQSQASIARAPSGISREFTQQEGKPTVYSDTIIQMGRDGRVRPVAGARRLAQWTTQACETTFPANRGPITTKMLPLREEVEPATTSGVDRSDVVLQFVDHRKNKIKRYVSEVSARFPIPIECTVEGSKNSKLRMRVHFGCQSRGRDCVFRDSYLFAMKTKNPAVFLHLMFLQMEASALEASGRVACQSTPAFQTLAHCWQCLPTNLTKGKPFVTLVTSAFPTAKELLQLEKELDSSSFFDCFSLDPDSSLWTCFSCAQPDKARCLSTNSKMLEGQLKEKRGRWRFLSRWHTKYFTLSTGALTASTQNNQPSPSIAGIDLRTVRSVRSLSRGRKSRGSLRRVFEISTTDNSSVVLKATDAKSAEEWLQCIQIAVAHAKRDS